MTRSQRILITGGAGFLGAALAASLLREGHHVVAFDHDFSADRLPDHAQLTRVTGDILDHELVRTLVAEADRVVHFAAIANVHDYIERPTRVLDINILGTRGMFQACLEHKRPILSASTSEVYGKNARPLSEHEDTLLGPPTNARWCYATSKIAGEQYAWAFARQGLDVTVVRYFNVYGPLLDRPGSGRVISQFLGQLQRDEPLVLVDGGSAVRSFCYVDDAVEATRQLLLSVGENPATTGRPFNIGRTEPISMKALADVVLRLSGHERGTVDVPGRTFFGAGFEDIPHRVPDVSALRAATGWSATLSLEEGVRRVLSHWGLLSSSPTRATTPRVLPAIRPMYDVDDRLMNELKACMTSGWTTNHGPHTQALEQELHLALGCPDDTHVMAVANGADGLLIATASLALEGPVILPAYTYIATLNGFVAGGHPPLFADVDPHTWTLCPDHVAHLLEAHPDVVAVCAVNSFGIAPDLERLGKLCAHHGAVLVYDAAHGIGTEVYGQRYDATPRVTAWSLHATKILPGFEGGVLATSDDELAARLRKLRNHGLPRLRSTDAPDLLHEALVPGFNAKITEPSAAVARHGLQQLDAILQRRRHAYHHLRDGLAEQGWTLQHIPEGCLPNGQNLVVHCHRSAEQVLSALAQHGVHARRYFFPALHRLTAMPEQAALPQTELLADRGVCLPLYSRMMADECAQVLHACAHAIRG